MFNIQSHIDLTTHNTFHLKAYARYYGELTHKSQLHEICLLPEFNRETVLWLGGGSNVLFRQDYPSLVVKVLNKGIKIIKETHKHVLIEAQAGENWHNFIQYTISLGLSGLENLSLIPGTVGAAPIQNIGAYGVEVKDHIHQVECFDLYSQKFVQLNRNDCKFDYRDSLFKQQGKRRYVITAVQFWLDKNFHPKLHYGDLAQTISKQYQHQTITAQMVAETICQIRRHKLPDPNQIGNVGSFYKNPIIPAKQAQQLQQQYPNIPYYPQHNGKVKIAAAWLIDQCGLKGQQIGGAAVHQQQALVLINQNHATAQDVAHLSDYICQTVQQRFGIALETEPNWLPENIVD